MSAGRRWRDAANMAGHWTLNSHIEDVSDHGADGTWGGTGLYADGPYGKMGADFDATNRITTTDTTLRFEGVPFTSAFWLKPDTLTNYDGFCGATLNGSYPDGWGFYYNASVMYFYLGNLTVEVATTALTLDGTWHHFAGTWDGATINIYKDGKIGTGKANATGATATAGFYWMGALGAAGGSNCDAKMLDNRLYTVALTGDEIADMAEKTKL